jgi:hypothetical protein
MTILLTHAKKSRAIAGRPGNNATHTGLSRNFAEIDPFTACSTWPLATPEKLTLFSLPSIQQLFTNGSSRSSRSRAFAASRSQRPLAWHQAAGAILLLSAAGWGAIVVAWLVAF